ncbi:unnamed protein product [Allacma fusca]|uniref:Uncharacterized protein n=1 Tax=Allacma fusca TaxID=39272 RepID=A0A8J2L5N0_9HEXA|nr:unnamed protein product [Allacma fusca]
MGATKLFWIVALAAIISSEASAQRTNFVNHDSKISHLAEPQWFRDNIPFVEVPNKEIEEVYYYRWSSLKRHLRYTVPGAGYIVTEFVHKVGYSLKFDTINAAAGHHINEARWLRDRRYVQDYVNFWTREGGDPNAYSEWIADAAYNSYLIDGDEEFMKSQLKGLIRNYRKWDDHYDDTWKMYWISPHWDAMEYSCSSVQTDDPYHGGAGFRPSFNAEMYANAVAISKIAALNGEFDIFLEYQTRAESIKAAMNQRLWDPQRKFFYHAFKDNNPNFELLDSREEIGFFPWQYRIPGNTSEYVEAWEQLFDAQGFGTLWGPTTCEVRSQWYDGNQTGQCCWWNGNSWPYSTSLTLKALAAQVRDYANSAVVTVNEYLSELHKYALTQYKNDKPYVAECHSPVRKLWVCDGFNNSEHYAHSTYTDNVLSDLIGIQPRPDNNFEINPLNPSNWRFFAAENIPYHGHEVTVLYDADGSYYESGHSGLQIFVNGDFVRAQPNIGRMTVPVPAPVARNGQQNIANYASNPNSEGYPAPRVSYTSPYASEWHPLDGRVFYDYTPLNRWTNYGSGNPTDWFAVDFGPGRSKNISQIKLYVYSDVVTGEGGVDCPKKMEVEFYDGQEWRSATNQRPTPSVCSPNDVNTIDFDPVSTQQVRVVFTRDVENNYYIGLTELEIWAAWPQSSPQGYEAEDGLIVRGSIKENRAASGTSFVGDLVQDDSSVEFTGVWLDSAGTYSIKVFYVNEGNEAKQILAANNDVEVPVTYPTANDEFASFVTVEVALQRGSNVLIFRKDTNSVSLDRIEIGGKV